MSLIMIPILMASEKKKIQGMGKSCVDTMAPY